jgi:hypothetical protein
MYSLGVTYLLWLFLGFFGVHRFYLGRIGTGLLYLATGAFFGVGWIVDFFRIPSLVRESNLRLRYHDALFGDRPIQAPGRVKESIERTILRTARRNNGKVTPSEIALEGDCTIEQAEKALEKLAAGGHAEMHIRDSGVIEYRFAEFERES